MGQSAAELRREIEDTRGDLGETLDAIGDRVSPARMIERRKNRMSEGARLVRERVMGTADHAGQAAGDVAGDAIDTLKSAPEASASADPGQPAGRGRGGVRLRRTPCVGVPRVRDREAGRRGADGQG